MGCTHYPPCSTSIRPSTFPDDSHPFLSILSCFEYEVVKDRWFASKPGHVALHFDSPSGWESLGTIAGISKSKYC